MVAGKVKVVMGLQKSPSMSKADRASPATKSHSPFSRSFFSGRCSSAQVQPRPPDISELVGLIDDLRNRENKLMTELLELKIARETASIVPIIEKQLAVKEGQLANSLSRIRALESENEKLRQELDEETRKVKVAEAEVEDLKKIALVREAEDSASSLQSSSSQRFLGLMEASTARSLSFNRSAHLNGNINAVQVKRSGSGGAMCNIKSFTEGNAGNWKGLQAIKDNGHNIVVEVEDEPHSDELAAVAESLTLAHHHIVKSRAPRVPKPPPKRSSSSASSLLPSSSPSFSPSKGSRKTTSAAAAPPPPPPPPPRATSAATKKAPPVPQTTSAALKVAPPPPPPPPLKKTKSGTEKVRRVPEVVEFYHSLMRRDSRRDPTAEVAPATANPRDMIGEIENRSTHLLAIKTDVETQGDFIRFLIREVNDAAFTEIEDVVPFVKWLDDELSYLVDERAVLKHFDWPEQKADALREAAFGYCDLKKLESEVSSLYDDPRQPCCSALKKLQALLEKLEHAVYNLSKLRESASTRYKTFGIPMNWMLESGIVSQIKLASVKLAMKYMKRVSAELEVGGGPEDEELIVQGVRFAFRVHQFAGGFDMETMRAFQELRDKAESCHVQCHNQQQHHKLLCRPTL